MSAEKMIGLQQQMRQNQFELQDYLKDLDSWTSDIKQKDETLTKQTDTASKELPPVRNSLDKKKRKKKKSKTESEKTSEKKRISGFDFKAWDKFDVDKACEEVERADEGSSSEYETDEEWEELRCKQQAILMKDQGNQYFKEGRYDEAIECYTRGIDSDPTNALLPANRAMALLKQDKFGAAELDCCAALSLDPTYIKAYQRRGTARMSLEKYKEAKEDYQHVLKLEPASRLAKTELEKLEKLMNPPKFSVSSEGDTGIVHPITKPLDKRSKKPLRRLVIEEVGEDEEEAKRRQAEEKAKASQSQTKQKLVHKDNEDFEKFTAVKTRKITFASRSDSSGVSEKRDDEAEEPSSMSPADISQIVQQISSAEQESSGVWGEPCEKSDFQTKVESDLRLDLNDLNNERSSDSRVVTDCDSATNKKAVTTDAVVTDERPVISPQTSPRVPPVPATAFQFQADWKVLKNTTEQFYQYLKGIKPSVYPKLFGQFLDAEILQKILNTIHDFYIPNNDDIIPVMESLPAVKRFGMIVMFMSSKDKHVVRSIFDHVERLPSCDTSDLNKLKKQYEL